MRTHNHWYHLMSAVEKEYLRQIDALAGKERVARSMAMLQWTREMLARQIVAEAGAMRDEQLKWEVARRLYGSDPAIREMIERRSADVSR
jgi:hypothetical protein